MLKITAAIAALTLAAGSAEATLYQDQVSLDTSTLTFHTNAIGQLLSVSGTFDVSQTYTLAPGDLLLLIGVLTTSVPVTNYTYSPYYLNYQSAGLAAAFPGYNYVYDTQFLQSDLNPGDIDWVRITYAYSAGQPTGDTFVVPAGPLTFDVLAVPEPASWALMLIGIGSAGAVLRRRRGNNAMPQLHPEAP